MARVRCEPICGIWRYMLQASHNKLGACCALMGKVAGCKLRCVVLGEAERIFFLLSSLLPYPRIYPTSYRPPLSLFRRVHRLYNALIPYLDKGETYCAKPSSRWLYLEARLLRSLPPLQTLHSYRVSLSYIANF